MKNIVKYSKTIVWVKIIVLLMRVNMKNDKVAKKKEKKIKS